VAEPVAPRTPGSWIDSDRRIPTLVRPLLRFTQVESAGGIVLLVAAAAALAWANAPFGGSYERFWSTPLHLGPVHLDESLRVVVNDGLMTVFFLVVGLEIRRELVSGDLRDARTAALPAIAALGGMIFPALIYLAFTIPGGEGTRGWGIPMATDIAFALGVISLLGGRVPVSGRLFLLALAIADDIGAIIVIAVFYADSVALGFVAAAAGGVALMYLGRRMGIRSWVFYLPMALAVWFLLFQSGVQATLAGVAIALVIPATSGESASPETALHPWSSLVIVPVFALANVGVRFVGVDLGAAVTHPIALGVAIGLLAGKVVGITAFTWVAVRLRLGALPRHISWRHVVGLAAIAGIGFTVSLFVTDLAFDTVGTADLAKTGIFLGSAAAGVTGFVALRTMKPLGSDESEP